MTKHDSYLEIHKGDLVDHEVMYGKRISFPVWLKSTATSAIRVRAVTAELHPDNGWRGDSSRFVFRNEVGLQLAAGDRDITSVAVIPTLDSLPNSNYVSISVEYEALGKPGGPLRRVERRDLDWITVKDVATPPGAEVFVSYVDPENEDLAQLGRAYLQRAGFNSFLARHDRQPGCDIWTDKIEPAIARVAGTLVIWSVDTTRRPGSVKREIRLSQDRKVPVALFLSKGAKAPKEYPSTELEYTRYDPKAPHAAFADGVSALASRLRNMGRCF